jgi:hypothetical protein
MKEAQTDNVFISRVLQCLPQSCVLYTAVSWALVEASRLSFLKNSRVNLEPDEYQNTIINRYCASVGRVSDEGEYLHVCADFVQFVVSKPQARPLFPFDFSPLAKLHAIDTYAEMVPSAGHWSPATNAAIQWYTKTLTGEQQRSKIPAFLLGKGLAESADTMSVLQLLEYLHVVNTLSQQPTVTATEFKNPILINASRV